MYRSYVQCPSMFALTLLLLLSYSRLLYAQQVCYYPDGTEATDHTPCNSSASNTPTDASSCCHDNANSYCQDNNLCTWNGAMYRGACTDKTWTSPNCPQQCTEAQRNTGMNIFPCPAAGVWECERSGNCVSNFTLPSFGILLRDSQLPGNKREGIGLADPNASNTSAVAAGATVTVTAGTAPSNAASSSTPTVTKSKKSNALAVGLGVGIPLGLLLVACIALLFWQRSKLKEERSVAPPLEVNNEKSREDQRAYPGTYNAQELPEHQAMPELRHNKNSVHELGGHYMPGSPPPLSKA